MAHSTGDAKNGNGVRIPTDSQLNMVVAPGTQLWAAGSAGDAVSASVTLLPWGTLLNTSNKIAALLELVTRQLALLVEARPNGKATLQARP